MGKSIPWWVAGLLPAALVMGGPKTGFFAAQGATDQSRPASLDSRDASRLVTRQVAPDYPPVAKVNYIQGLVRLRVVVTREGRVSEAHVLEGHPTLAAAALKAAHRWAYRPLVTSSGPVAFETFVDMRFTLRPRKVDQVPQQPERDLSQRVRPPQVLAKSGDPPSAVVVCMRVLVGESGQALDSFPLKGNPSDFLTARKTVESWKFQPARWGAVRIPWYLEVDVPVETSAAQRTP